MNEWLNEQYFLIIHSFAPSHSHSLTRSLIHSLSHAFTQKSWKFNYFVLNTLDINARTHPNEHRLNILCRYYLLLTNKGVNAVCAGGVPRLLVCERRLPPRARRQARQQARRLNRPPTSLRHRADIARHRADRYRPVTYHRLFTLVSGW